MDMNNNSDIKFYDIAAITFFAIIAIGSAINMLCGAWWQIITLIMSLVMVLIHSEELRQLIKKKK